MWTITASSTPTWQPAAHTAPTWQPRYTTSCSHNTGPWATLKQTGKCAHTHTHTIFPSFFYSSAHTHPRLLCSGPVCKKVMGGMEWNPALRGSTSSEHLETKSLPSRSPPLTPNWYYPHHSLTHCYSRRYHVRGSCD